MEEKIEQYLQKEYKEHIKWYKKHYYDTNYNNYDNWYKEREEEYSDLVVCASCNEVIHEDYGKQTEHDGFICEQCLIDGYGQ